MGKRSIWKMFNIILVFYAATAIVSPAQILTTLHSFNGTDGTNPQGLVKAADGNFYGTTAAGGSSGNCGSYGCGTVFKITPDGTLTTLYNFCSQPNCPDGFGPDSGVIQATDGNFYGTTFWGGRTNGGTVFRITASGTLTTLYSFCSQPNCTDGGAPYAGLVQASDGNFYGTTSVGGTGHGLVYSGTVFKMTPNGTLTTVYNFCSQANCADGAGPFAALVQVSGGNFYGTTYFGGVTNQCYEGCGTVFRVTPSGTLTTLHIFTGYPTDGAYPPAGLLQATDGNFYGTTFWGGANQNCTSSNANGCGTVFKITPAGALTILHSFDSTDGSSPETTLIQVADGNFYGTAYGAPEYGGGSPGTVFQITPGGTFNAIYKFCAQNPCNDGLGPWELVQGTNDMLYGTTVYGGGSINCLQGCGTVFRLIPAGASPTQFIPMAPCRLLDTRPQYGGSGPIQGGTSRDLVISQLGGCHIPTTAAAYSLNVTVVPQGLLGYLTIWPTGESRPISSTLNSDGRVKADAAIVIAGSQGAVSVYVTNTTNLVLDINGYFEPTDGSTLAYYPLKPCRVADTRNANGPLGGPHLTTGQERDFPILDASACDIPSSAQAYSLNFTVVPRSDPVETFTAWRYGQPRPVSSTLNAPTGTVVANAAIVSAGTGGEIATWATNDTDLVIDIDGYFAPAGAGGLSLYAVAPCRVIDTRKGNGAFNGVLSPPVDVADSVCAPPSTAQAYVLNATVVPTGSLAHLDLWPDGEDRPGTSTLNDVDGAITSNMAVVPNINGKTDAYALGLTQLILDISAYFAP